MDLRTLCVAALFLVYSAIVSFLALANTRDVGLMNGLCVVSSRLHPVCVTLA